MTETITLEDTLHSLKEQEEESLETTTDYRERLIHQLRIADMNNILQYLMYPDSEALVTAQRKVIKYMLDGEYCGNHTFMLEDYDLKQTMQS